MCIRSSGAPALVRELLQLCTFVLKLTVKIVVKWVAVDVNHQNNPFPCASPLLDLLREVCVKECSRIRLQTSELYVPHVLLVDCFESL